jgi:CRISPR-associated protein Cas2
MDRKKKTELSFVERMLLMKRAGFSHTGASFSNKDSDDFILEPLEQRIKSILQINERNHLNANEMLFFIMYDIENNKVRTQIAKYLIKKGCLRVQKSIFFAETERKVFNEIHSDLKDIQELYDNMDSIFFVPVSSDQLRAMKIVGQSIDFELITGNKNTLFF